MNENMFLSIDEVNENMSHLYEVLYLGKMKVLYFKFE